MPGLRSIPVVCFVLFVILFCLLPTYVVADDFFANPLGDFDDVAVFEVSGNYDALIDGQWNHEARKVIAREFYRTHGDDYDFLVIFTNFDFAMPEAEAAAFFAPVQNSVQGIGLDQFNYSAGYAPDGQPLERLQGTIDMANLAGYVTDPTDPGFETTLKILAHEWSHRWGAYVHFIDETGQESGDLLGIDSAHWSFLLDSQGSTLYGNHWRDNGDGTYTSITPEQGIEGGLIGRIFSPLDLYLMGLLAPEDVPGMTLLDSPGVVAAQLPRVGETIVATPRNVTIGQVIAAEGARLPAAGDSQGAWRVGYLYAVVPGSWDPDSRADRAETAAIAAIDREWAQRFSVLTDGAAAILQPPVPGETVADENPGVTVPDPALALEPDVGAGVAWLAAHQDVAGFWQDRAGTAPCDTALAVAALQVFPLEAARVASGRLWLAAQPQQNQDYFARRVLALAGDGAAELLPLQNPDGGWGTLPGYQSSALDTALVLQALLASPAGGESEMAGAVAYLLTRQNPDGGWGRGQSMLQSTAAVLLALEHFSTETVVSVAIEQGLVWLQQRQNFDGGFGLDVSSVYETAAVLLALQTSGSPRTVIDAAVAYLLGTQAETGSWRESVFQTALAVQALYATQIASDLKVEADDLVVVPEAVDVFPADVTLVANVWNLGDTDLSDVRVTLSAGAETQEQLVAIAGHTALAVSFPLQIDAAGYQTYSVAVEPAAEVVESSVYNNVATREFYVGPPPPEIRFAATAARGSEAVTSVEVAVVLDHAWEEPVSVAFAPAPEGTAEAGSDFALASGILTIPAGDVSGSIVMEIIDDQVVENSETVLLQLSNPQNCTLGDALFTYEILDDDLLPTVAIQSPVDGQTYTTRRPVFSYTTNMPLDLIAVSIDGEPVSSSSGYNLALLSYGAHTIRVEAQNPNGIIAVDEVTFFIDDTGLPPDMVWSRAGEAHKKIVFDDDGGFYSVYSQFGDIYRDRVFEKVDQSWRQHWELEGPVADFTIARGQIYLLQEKSGGDYLQIYEPGGQLLWEKPSPVSDGRIVVDNLGNIIIGGRVFVDMRNKPNQTDIVVYKFDPYGHSLGMRQIGNELDESFGDLAVGPDGTIYVAGDTMDWLGTDPDASNAGGEDFFVAKISADLETVAIKQFGTTLDDQFQGLCVDSQNNLLLAAITAGSFDGVLPEQNTDAVLVRINDRFEVDFILQEHQINWTVELAVDREGGVYLAGAAGEYGSYRTHIIKYTAAGESEWRLTAYDQTLYRHFVNALYVDEQGSLYLSFQDSYPNYQTGYWESRYFLRKFGTGIEEDLPPILTVTPLTDGFSRTTRTLGGTRESGGDVTVQDTSSAVIGPVVYPDETTWRCDVSAMAVGEHRFTISLTASNGRTRETFVSAQVSPLPVYQNAWKRQFGSAGSDRVSALAVVGENTIYAFGGTLGIWGTDLTTTTDDLLRLAVSAENGLVISPAWQRDLGQDNYVLDAARDAGGNFYYLWENIFGGFVSKFDETGQELWRQQIDAKQYHYPRALSLDAQGNVFVCGYTKAALAKQAFGGIVDYFVAKYDTSGNRQWLRLSGEAEEVYAYDLDVAEDGVIWLVGERVDSLGHALPQLFRLDSSGGMSSVVTVDPHNGQADAIAISSDGSVFVSGSADFMRGTGQDMFLVKYDAAANPVWRTDFTLPLDCWVDALHVMESGDLLIMGSQYVGNIHNPDALLIRVEATGLGAQSYPFASDSELDFGTAVASDAAGSIYVGGWTYGGLAGENAGSSDIFIAKLQPVTGPSLDIDPYETPTSQLSQVISGTVAAGAFLEVRMIAPAETSAEISALTQNPDGSWWFTVSNVTPNITYVLGITATNEYGTTEAAIALTVDTLPPALTVHAVTSPTPQQSQVITGTVEEGALLTIEVNPPATAEMVPEVSGAWSVTVGELAEGENLVRVVAMDAAGNQTSETVAISYVPPASLAVTVTPTQVSADASAEVWLTVANLQPYESSLAVEQRVDLDRDGLVDVDEPVVRRFILVDGVVDGNGNVPADEDALVNGHVAARLRDDLVNDRLHAPAASVFSVVQGDSSAEASFEVSEVAEQQAISGRVADDLGGAVAGAFVGLTDLWGRGYGYAVSDAAGDYWIQTPFPGEYRLMPLADGYFYDQAVAGMLQLEAGQVQTGVDLLLGVGAHRLSGRVIDAATGQGLAGIWVCAKGTAGTASSMSAWDGSYALDLPAGAYELTVEALGGGSPADRGYLVPATDTFSVDVLADSSDHDIALTRADSLIVGHVQDAAGLAVSGVPVVAVCLDGCGLAYGSSDAAGQYTLGVLTGHAWQIRLFDDAAQPLEWVGPVLAEVPAVTGTWEVPVATLFPTSAVIEGRVVDDRNNGVADVTIQVANQTSGSEAMARTNAEGRYRLQVDAGECQLTIRPELQGYDPVSPINVAVASGQTVLQDFVVSGPVLDNTIIITKALYNLRKKILDVVATSTYPDAQLILDGYGPMLQTKALKGVYTWEFSDTVASTPTSVTVSGPEGSATLDVSLK